MHQRERIIFLADDDVDDCDLFEDALNEVSEDVTLKTAGDGIKLMNILVDTVPPAPDVIFLDLNMPRKNGFECLAEIKSDSKLKNIPVIIFSTSAEKEFIDRVYSGGANYYLCKPQNFSKLKTAISTVLQMDWQKENAKPVRDKFLLAF
jgi:CheY-like chemotaxis protein